MSGADEISRLKAERDEARQIVRDIHWMARRYCNGRLSYAPGMFNDAIRKAIEGGWLPEPQNGEPILATEGKWESTQSQATPGEGK